MRLLHLLGAAAAARLVCAAPLEAQSDDRSEASWHLEGLRKSFCVQLLIDPASKTLRKLPQGYRPLPASRAGELHITLRGVVEGQPEYASWSPSRLCFHTLDSIGTSEFTAGDRSGRHPQLLAIWTVSAADPGGAPREVALDLFTNSERLIRSAKLAGQSAREARVTVGKVPTEDENGVPSDENRFQFKVGKTTLTWDGRLVSDSMPVSAPVEAAWVATGTRGGVARGRISLSPALSRAMVGSLRVEGKDDLAKTLRASPTRFAGPAYEGGGGTVSLAR